MKRKNIVAGIVFLTMAMFLSNQGQPNKGAEFQLKKLHHFARFGSGLFAPDGSHLVLVGENRLSVVKIPSGDQVCQANIGTLPIRTLTFSPNGQSLAVSHSEYNPNTDKNTRTISLIDASNCKTNKIIAQEVASFDDNRYLSFSSDGRYLVGNMNSVRMWDVQSGAEVFRYEFTNGFNPNQSRLSPDGKWLITCGTKFVAPTTFHLLQAIDMDSKKVYAVADEDVDGFTFSGDSKFLYVNFSYPVIKPGEWTTDSKIKGFKVGSWDLVSTYDDKNITVAFDVSRDGKFIAVGGRDGKFRLFSLPSGELTGEEYHYKRTETDDRLHTPHLTSFVGPVRFSPDGSMLLTGGPRGNVILWKVKK